MKFVLHPQSLTRAFATIVAVLTGLHLAAQLSAFAFGYEHLLSKVLLEFFDTDAEKNVPAFYSSLALLCSAVLLAVIARGKRRERDRFALHWYGLAIVFVGLGLDESIELHEHLMTPVHNLLDPSGPFLFAWYIPVGAALVVFVLAYLRFLRHLPRETRLRFVAAGALFVGGAIGFEMLSSVAYENQCNPCDFSADSFRGNPAYTAFATLEELLEMVGIVVFIDALTRYVSEELHGVSVEVRYPAKAATS